MLEFIKCEMCSGQLDVWLLSALVSLAGIKRWFDLEGRTE